MDICFKKNVDELLNALLDKRNVIMSLLEKDPQTLARRLWKDNNLLQIDNNCLCHLGQIKERTSYCCFHCKSLGRLIDYSKWRVGEPFMIECGREVGKRLIVFQERRDRLGLRIEESSVSATNTTLFISPTANERSLVGREMKGSKIALSDPLTNHLLTSWFLREISNEVTPEGVSHSIKVYTGFICRDKGFILAEYLLPISPYLEHLKREGEGNNLENEINITMMVKQLLVFYDSLRENNFSHGDPTTYSLFISLESCAYEYKDMKIVSPFTLKVGGNSLSSIRVANLTLTSYNRNSYWRGPFRYNYKTKENFIESKLRGSNPYSLAFDIYCFIVSLYLLALELSIGGESTLVKGFDLVWTLLWKSEFDRGRVEDRIGGKSNTVEDITLILEDIDLDPNILEKLEKALK